MSSFNNHQNDESGTEQILLLVAELKKIVNDLKCCESRDSLLKAISESELSLVLESVLQMLQLSNGSSPTLLKHLSDMEVLREVLSPIFVCSSIYGNHELQNDTLQLFVLLTTFKDQMDDVLIPSSFEEEYMQRAAEIFVEPIGLIKDGQTPWLRSHFSDDVNLLWFFMRLFIRTILEVLNEGWSVNNKMTIRRILHVFIHLTSSPFASLALYGERAAYSRARDDVILWLIRNRFYSVICILLGTQSVQEEIPETIMSLLVCAVAAPFHSVTPFLGVGLLTAAWEQRTEQRQCDIQKSTIMESIHKPYKRMSSSMRWSSHHNSHIPIVQVFKSGDRKFGHWENRSDDSDLSKVCDKLLQLTKSSFESRRLSSKCSEYYKQSASSILTQPSEDIASRRQLSEKLEAIQEILDTCIEFIFNGILNRYSSLSSYAEQETNSLLFGVAAILSTWIRLLFSTLIEEKLDQFVNPLQLLLDDKVLKFFMLRFSEMGELRQIETERMLLTTITDYLSLLLVFVSGDQIASFEAIDSSRFDSLYSHNLYSQCRFQAKQVVTTLFEKQDLHQPLISFLKTLTSSRRDSRSFLYICIQNLTILVQLKNTFEKLYGTQVAVQRRRRKRGTNWEDEEREYTNNEQTVMATCMRDCTVLLLPLIRTTTFHLLLIPFQEVLEGESHHVQHTGEWGRVCLVFYCRLAISSWKELWKTAGLHSLRPLFYSVTILAFLYAITQSDTAVRFERVFKDGGRFLFELKLWTKELTDAFAFTFQQNIFLGVDALFPISCTLSHYYEALATGRHRKHGTCQNLNDETNTRIENSMRKQRRKHSVVSSNSVSSTEVEEDRENEELSNDKQFYDTQHSSSSKFLSHRKRVLCISEDEDD